MGYSPLGCKELNITEHAHMHAHNEVELESHYHIVIIKDCKDGSLYADVCHISICRPQSLLRFKAI